MCLHVRVPLGVGDGGICGLIERHVEIHADQYALSAHVDRRHAQFGEAHGLQVAGEHI